MDHVRTFTRCAPKAVSEIHQKRVKRACGRIGLETLACNGGRSAFLIRRTAQARTAPQGQPRGKDKWDPHCAFFAEISTQDGDITMLELASVLHDTSGVRAHPNAIGKLLRKFGYSQKRWLLPDAAEPRQGASAKTGSTTVFRQCQRSPSAFSLLMKHR